MNTCEKLTLVNSFYAIVSDSGKLYSVEMNWENACKMANFYNSTIKGEGKISIKEISKNDNIVIGGEFAK